MPNKPILSPRDVLAAIHAALPPQRQGQRELPRLARHLCNLTASADLPDRLDAWLALNRWLAGGALWSDVYIDSADVHGSATQRFAVLMGEYNQAIGDGKISINEAKRLLRETLAIQQVLLDMKLNLEEEAG